MSIVDDPRFRHNPDVEAELAAGWEPESEAETWEPDGLDDPISWLPSDSWFDRQAEIYEAKRSDVADFAANWFRETARAFRALDAGTLDEFIARSETYPA